MKKPELLAPAGNMDALKAAILGGCDAIYLGGYMFGARNFANNFDYDELKEAVNYAHEYGVKIYVTTNTLIYENEVERFIKYIKYLNDINVDAVIMQDIGMMDLVRKRFKDLDVHASTQMHIHNLEGTKFVESRGCTRAVLARETDYETIKHIKENTNIELEIFVHGALCISYSGQCLMSSLIGNRSGNRGTCAGSCRLKYDVLDNNLKKVNTDEYNLSTKDLNSLDNLEKLIQTGADSFKIEGRMKSPAYVYLVTKLYRQAIDSYFEYGKIKYSEEDLLDLKKTFNRLFTKGFLFKEKNNEIINPFRPNHIGINLGKVIEYKNDFVTIKLDDDLSINDGIRILGNNDYGFIVTSMFKNKKRIDRASKGDIISIPCKERIKVNSKCLKTTDNAVIKKVNNEINTLKRKVKITGTLDIIEGDVITLHISDGLHNITKKGNIIVEYAKNMPTDVNRIKEQIMKTGNSIYEFEYININMDNNLFVPIKEINEIRRAALEELKLKRLEISPRKESTYEIDIPFDFEHTMNKSIYIKNIKQYNMIKNFNFESIYMEEDLFNKIEDSRKILKIPRVQNKHKEYDQKILVGELGSVHKYKNIDTDFSLNIVNSYSVALLHSLGVNKITLSYELEEYQIEEIITAYKNRYNKLPNLEVIIYGKEEVMISKFNILDYYNIKNTGFIRDKFKNLYRVISSDNLMYIYNFKPRKIINYKNLYKIGVNSVRYNFVDEENVNIF